MSNIVPLGDPNRHFWLTRSVARSIGLSLSEAMAQGHLSQKAYAELVTNCRRCQFVDECEAWLAKQCCRSGEAPECCRHAETFQTLKTMPRRARGR